MRIRNLLAIVAIMTLVGCKIVIKVPEGGRVVSSSGTYTCEAGEKCVIDVSDYFFDETFTAEPADGWRFTKWKKIDRGLCGGRSKACRLFTSAFEGSEPLTALLESPKDRFFLIPKFINDGAVTASNCEYTQSTPGGDFEVCHAHDAMDLNACSALGGALTSVDCTDNSPVGYCATSDGDVYYYEGDTGSLEMGCGFAPGEWHNL